MAEIRNQIDTKLKQSARQRHSQRLSQRLSAPALIILHFREHDKEADEIARLFQEDGSYAMALPTVMAAVLASWGVDAATTFDQPDGSDDAGIRDAGIRDGGIHGRRRPVVFGQRVWNSGFNSGAATGVNSEAATGVNSEAATGVFSKGIAAFVICDGARVHTESNSESNSESGSENENESIGGDGGERAGGRCGRDCSWQREGGGFYGIGTVQLEESDSISSERYERERTRKQASAAFDESLRQGGFSECVTPSAVWLSAWVGLEEAALEGIQANMTRRGWHNIPVGGCSGPLYTIHHTLYSYSLYTIHYTHTLCTIHSTHTLYR
jgi:hypothetical protein